MIAPTTRQITLTRGEWDENRHGWRCPDVGMDGVIVENIFFEGREVDVNHYQVNQNHQMIYWRSRDYMPHILAVNLSGIVEQGTSNKWIYLAAVPIIVAIISSPVWTEWYKHTFGKDYVANPSVDKQSRIEQPSNLLGRYAIALETITQEDGGLDAAKKQLEMKAVTKGYKNNSVILKYQDTYRVVIYFPTELEAQSQLEKAKAINKTVDNVKDLNSWCGNYSKVEDKIFKCFKNILN